MPSKYGFGNTRKKNAPTYMKSSGFKMKGSPFSAAAASETDTEYLKRQAGQTSFDPRGANVTYDKYRSDVLSRRKNITAATTSASAVKPPLSTPDKPMSRGQFEQVKGEYGKAGEAGYTDRGNLARMSQMGGSGENVWWEEEDDLTAGGGGRTTPITKKSPTKASYFSADQTPVMKKSSGFKMKGHTLPGIKQKKK